MAQEYVPFEKPIADLENKIIELQKISATSGESLVQEIEELEKTAHKLRVTLFSNLTPYQVVQLSRHPRRPTTLEMIQQICEGFTELHGDRNYFDDRAIVGGLAKIGSKRVMILGHQKGRNTKENIVHNFGMPKPEGYRKALRLMNLAARFNLPIITLIDTPGAYPGVGAEQRGQSEAIGKNIMIMARFKVPVITLVIGEGGSGGALALAVANRVYMLQYATYSVISPEGCASILMKSKSQAEKAAKALKLTAQNALKLGLIDGIIEEPLGGAHLKPQTTALSIKSKILEDLNILQSFSPDELMTQRYSKFKKMGAFKE